MSRFCGFLSDFRRAASSVSSDHTVVVDECGYLDLGRRGCPSRFAVFLLLWTFPEFLWPALFFLFFQSLLSLPGTSFRFIPGFLRFIGTLFGFFSTGFRFFKHLFQLFCRVVCRSCFKIFPVMWTGLFGMCCFPSGILFFPAVFFVAGPFVFFSPASSASFCLFCNHSLAILTYFLTCGTI